MSVLYILGGTVIHYVNIAPITQRVMGFDPFSDAQIDRYVDNFIGILQRP